MILRPYQREAVDNVREVWDRGIPNALIVLPTGAGKTVTFSALIREVLAEYSPESGAVALVVAHRTELLTQAQDKYLKADPHETVGIYQGGRKEAWARVICASVASLYGDKLNADGTVKRRGRINDLPLSRIKVLVIDEAHHAIAQSYLDLIETVRQHSPDCLMLGVTATPYRTDGGLGQLWNCYLTHEKEPSLRADTIKIEDVTGAVAAKLSMADGINMGFLTPFSQRSIRIVLDTVDLSKVTVSKKTRDFSDASLAEVMDTVDVRTTVVDKWFEHAGPGTPYAGPDGRPTIIFTAGVQAAIHLAEAFRDRGVTCAHVDGAMKRADRDAVLSAFESGGFLILINCQVLTEGYDAPHVSCICMCRPTKSQTMFVQAAGRGVRLMGQTIAESIANGKPDCLLLDFAGASAVGLVGLPDLTNEVEIDGVDRTEEERAEDELAAHGDDDMEQMVAEEMMGDPHRRITIRGVSEYPVDVFGDGKVVWMLINGTRVCQIQPGAAVLVYAGINGFTAIVISGSSYRLLAKDAPEAEAIARGQAYAMLNGTQSYIKPGPWFTGKPATPKQVTALAASIEANRSMDNSLGRDGAAALDVSGLPADLNMVSIAQASAWLAYLHARAAFGTRSAKRVDEIPSAVTALDKIARVKDLTASRPRKSAARV